MGELDTLDVALRLLAATALTGLIGAERELRERSAGLRTHMLVGVGACLFTLVSAYGFASFFTDEGRIDPTRIAAQIVSGIGFLGAGAILRQGLSVRGLTTAAGLWAVAAIGMACGAGFWSAALVATAIVMVGLGPFRWLERAVSRIGGDEGVLEVRLPPSGTIAPVLDVLAPHRARVKGIEWDDAGEHREVRLDVTLPAPEKVVDVLRELAEAPGVQHARWSD